MVATPAGYTWSPVTETSPKNGGGNSYHAFTFYLNATPSVNFAANTEVEIAEVAFSNSIGASNVGLACFEDDGTTDYFSISIGTTPDIVLTSAPFYGPGAANQTWLTGFSIVQVSNISLPVKFLSFFAIKNGDDAKLNWTVESDENNNFFEVERSTDGRVYRPLSKVAAKANGRSVNTYESADFALSKLGSNQVFYRIKQVDRDGQITFSNIRNLNAVRRGTPVQLFPNPVKSITKLVIDADAPGKASITIRDMGGKLVQQINTLLVRGVNQQDLNVASLASGEYTVLVVGEGFNHTLKLNKIN